MANERSGVITFKGNGMTLVGPGLKAGDAAPDFHTVDGSLQPVNLASSAGKVRLISVVPSLDTPVCSQQTKRFGDELAKLPDAVQVYTVSLDLPFAQGRWCGAEGVEMTTLSDYQQKSFGENYGVLIQELQLLTRAIFVVGKDDKIAYVEIVPEVTDHPDYDKALEAAKSAAG